MPRPMFRLMSREKKVSARPSPVLSPFTWATAKSIL